MRRTLELALDWVLLAPAWLGIAALVLAAVATALHRRGLRLLNGALLGGGLALAAFLLLRGAFPAPEPGAATTALSLLPGVAAIALGMLGAALGLASPGWGTAALVAFLLALAGGLAAHALGLVVAGVAAPCAGLGLWAGMSAHRKLAIWLTPVLCAPLAVLGAANVWAPNARGAALAQLNSIEWTLGALAAAEIALVALSRERERRRIRRVAEGAQRASDQQLKAAIEAKQRHYERALATAAGDAEEP